MAKLNLNAIYPVPEKQSEADEKTTNESERDRNGQKSLALKKRVLLCIIAGLIGGTGLYIWHANSQTNKTLNAAVQTSKNTPLPLKDPSQRRHYLYLQQWGVMGRYTGSAIPKYVVINSGHQRAYFPLVPINILSRGDYPECQVQNSSGAVIDRYEAGVKYEFKKDTSETVDQYLASSGGVYSRVGKYYYIASKSDFTCKSIKPDQELQVSILPETESITKSLTAYCSAQVPVCNNLGL